MVSILKSLRTRSDLVLIACLHCLVVLSMFGCEVDSYMDPSKTGYFEFTPTTMPILTRLDAIESLPATISDAEPPTPDDLLPSSLQYRLAPGDVVRVEIDELKTSGQKDVAIRVVDQSGNITAPTLGPIRAAGLTIHELQAEVIRLLQVNSILPNPVVDVILEQGRSFQYTVYGAVGSTGVYALTRPDFRLMEAVALAGGTPSTTQKIVIIRSVALDDQLEPFRRPVTGSESNPGTATTPGTNTPPTIDIEDLITQLENQPAPKEPEPAGIPATVPETKPLVPGDEPSPGAYSEEGDVVVRQHSLLVGQESPQIDIDDLEPVKVSDLPAVEQSGATTSLGSGNSSQHVRGGDQYVFDSKSQEWVKVPASADGSAAPPASGSSTESDPAEAKFATRVIEVDYQRLAQGQDDLNIVIRPSDRINVVPPDLGVCYVGGEVNRPGVYSLPGTGGLTLSRLIDAAGGLNGVAIPERVDLVRVVGVDREAAIRVSLAAIRNRAEPDIYIKPNDHVIIGTNFFATPLAVVRNGFRATYGFGFLLDRNFGNDVFGAPPSNIGN